ncbi:hypothetical protein JTE90_020651 [Oedothorax gibbosus]|uniref:EGF-like domain-containing protein n=1 Tax=Oedothorax gibbosus TaxID=931172 RepID=A0AAV6UUP0_9ARAC|nr:hypothetical protein JTE90_020651 [Oedothorax gibbosus]
MNIKVIPILLILIIFHEYCDSIAEAYPSNSSTKTRRHPEEKVSRAENINVSETLSKYKRNLKNNLSGVSSKNHSLSGADSSLKRSKATKRNFTKQNNSFSAFSHNKNRELSRSKSELNKFKPVYVITGVNVSEVYGSPLSKAQHIRKHRQIPEITNSDVFSDLLNQENVIDKFFENVYPQDSFKNEKHEDSSRKFRNITETKYSTINPPTTTTRSTTRERLYSDSIIQEPFSVSFGSNCDQHPNATTCWFERYIGDSVTLTVNISSFKEDNSFNVSWIKVYKRRHKESGVVVKIDPDRLPWNMEWKSRGWELRLSPITDSDTDPNAIAARVFSQRKSDADTGIFQQKIKQLNFRIDVRSIDVIEDNPRKDITINIGDFLTLPKSKAFWVDWNLEKLPGQRDALPSNFVINRSSLIVKNPGDNQFGVVSCIVYSAKGLAIGKRKFNITKKEEKSTMKSKKHSFTTYHQSNNHRNRSIRCTKRGYVKYALSDYMKPISRKKRFQRMTRWVQRRDCRNQKKNRRRLHPRWAPLAFLDADYNNEDTTTTLDPRLMSVSKLIELSEQSDGTIDDLIPHEVHYVDAEIVLVSDKFKTYPRSPNFEPNCTIDEDCGLGAMCIVPQGQKRRNVTREASKNHHRGYCYCRPEYYGDGNQCTKIPTESHREKRIRRK